MHQRLKRANEKMDQGTTDNEVHPQLESSDSSPNVIPSEIEMGQNSLNLIASDTVIEVISVESEYHHGEEVNSNEINRDLSDIVVPETVIVVECVSLDSEDEAIVLEDSKLGVEAPLVDVDKCSGGGLNGEEGEIDKVCRICHLSWDGQAEPCSDLIQLGCTCRGEIGTVHQHCAETWFKVKGNRSCEICGETAKNINGMGDSRFTEWKEMDMASVLDRNSSVRGRCCLSQPFCNLLMTCLVIAFVLPWFFRFSDHL